METYILAMKLSLLEDEMKARPVFDFVKIRMLGNWKQYKSGNDYEVNELEARELLSFGFAIKSNMPVEQAKE